MCKTVLLVADLQRDGPCSPHTLAARDVAAALVRGMSGHLHVLSVYAYDHIDTRRLPLTLVGPYYDEQLSRTDLRMEYAMDNYVACLAAEGIAVSTLLRIGKPRALIVQVATDLKADLLIMGTTRRCGRYGRTPSRVLRQISDAAPCPVLLIWPKQHLDVGTERGEELEQPLDIPWPSSARDAS